MPARRPPASATTPLPILRLLPLLLLAALGPSPLASQSGIADVGGGGGATAGAALARSLPATRPQSPPTIDGSLDEPAWAAAEAATGFVQRRPDSGAPASQDSEARVLFDDGALYVGMRLLDTAPDSVAATLGRRDFFGFSDWAQVIVDSYHDRRTAFRFGVNPAGVKADAYLSGDDEWSEDVGWDAVWDAAVTRDSLGWTAEMRIPLSQLRFSPGAGEWGIQFVRDLARRGERSLWAPAPPDEGGFVSRFGDLRGVAVAPRRRLEALPYLVGRLTRSPAEPGDPFHRPSEWGGSLGGDVRFGVTSDLTLTATLNPDFGQVEADPSEVNLTGAESFLSERRPFFQEGGDIFRLGMAEAPWVHGASEIFYSRRIGRAPRGDAPDGAAFAGAPRQTTLLGAGKLSGKTAGGWSLGLLNAVTAEERARFVRADGGEGSVPVEPLTSYTVGRVMRDYRQGRSALGAVVTSTIRRLGPDLDFLASSALVGGVDGRHRFAGGAWQVDARLVGSRLAGSAEAIDEVAAGPVHRQQRPDAEHVGYDSTRTSLVGGAAMLRFEKVAGGHWRGGVAGHAVTPGFDANDLGFHTASDFRRMHVWVGYDQFRSGRRLHRWSSWINTWSTWTFGDERTATGAELYGNLTFRNLWNGWGSLRRELPSLAPYALRGGAALHQPGRTTFTLGLSTDPRRTLSADLFNRATRGDQGEETLVVSPGATLRPSDRMELSLNPSFSRNRHPSQWVGTAGSGDSLLHLVGALSQTTASLTARLSYTFSPDLSLQLYAQPFVSAGRFTRLREVADAGAPDFDRRFVTYAPEWLRRDADRSGIAIDRDGDGRSDLTVDEPDFGFKELNSNLVLRWEYRPGSTFFLVWSQGRSGDVADGSFDLRRDAGRLLDLPSSHVLLLKWSHWLGR